MLVVDSVTNLKVIKVVRLVAPSAEACRSRKVLGGRFMKLIDVRFAVRAGDRLTLPYPFWAHYSVGQRVELADVARHPLGPPWSPIA